MLTNLRLFGLPPILAHLLTNFEIFRRSLNFHFISPLIFFSFLLNSFIPAIYFREQCSLVPSTCLYSCTLGYIARLSKRWMEPQACNMALRKTEAGVSQVYTSLCYLGDLRSTYSMLKFSKNKQTQKSLQKWSLNFVLNLRITICLKNLIEY